MRQIWLAPVLAVTVVSATGGLPSTAAAQHTKLSLESIGPNGGNGGQSADLVGGRKVGRRAFISTAERLVAADTDSSPDVYERTGGGTALVSTGAQGGNGAFPVNFAGAVAAGLTVLFQTEERLLADDTDSTMDVYRRDGPDLVLSSVGSSSGNRSHDAFLANATGNGDRIYMTTRESLVSSDTDSSIDVYQRSGGGVTLISTGPAGGNGDPGASWGGRSDDGGEVFFTTPESLVATDTDSQVDIYERTNGTTTLVSTGPNGGNGDYAVSLGGVSADGSRVFFSTAEPLLAADTDGRLDVYERSGGTTEIHSIGPSGGNGGRDASMVGMTDTGSQVFIETTEKLDTETDRDSQIDVYVSTGGAVTLLTPGARSAAADANFLRASSDGTRSFIRTEEALVAADTDGYEDVYMVEAGAVTLLSTGPAAAGGPTDAYFVGASDDGAHVFMETAESLVSADGDSSTDVYERHAGATTLLSSGPAGGNGAHDARFRGASADGKRVFFRTAEALVAADTDTSRDVYSSNVPGTVTVRLDAVPDDAQDFSFGATGLGATSFQLDDDLDPALVNTHVFSGVVPGDGYSVSQSPASGWTLAGATCDDGSQVGNIEVDAGEHVTCTFLDTRTYPRPVSATRLYSSLVVAYRECTAPNRTHGPPLDEPSCNPAAQASDFLTVGSDMVGSVRLAVIRGSSGTAADEADVKLKVTATDVRRQSTLDDYTGQLEAVILLRVTDRLNGPGQNEPATVADMAFTFPVSCTATPGPANVGATCSANTSADAVLPGAVVEIKRAIWEIKDIILRDGGADGLASTQGNTPFLRPGHVIP